MLVWRRARGVRWSTTGYCLKMKKEVEWRHDLDYCFKAKVSFSNDEVFVRGCFLLHNCSFRKLDLSAWKRNRGPYLTIAWVSKKLMEVKRISVVIDCLSKEVEFFKL